MAKSYRRLNSFFWLEDDTRCGHFFSMHIHTQRHTHTQIYIYIYIDTYKSTHRFVKLVYAHALEGLAHITA